MGNSEASIGSPPGKYSTAKQVVDHYSEIAVCPRLLRGKVAIVTGGNSGIGCETVKALAYAGCRVIMASRRTEAAGRSVQLEMQKPGKGAYVIPDDVEILIKYLDLEILSTIQNFAEDVLATEARIDYLILNAGIMALPHRELTENGWERQLAVNHFGHFYLTSLLLPRLTSQGHPCRIIVLASAAHNMGNCVVDQLHFPRNRRKYTPWKAYGQSKLANILFAKSLGDRLKGTNTSVFSIHPGMVATHLTRHQNFFARILIDAAATKTIPQGASTTLFALLDPDLPGVNNERSGSYVVDCAIRLPAAEAQDLTGELRAALWAETEAQLAMALERSQLVNQLKKTYKVGGVTSSSSGIDDMSNVDAERNEIEELLPVERPDENSSQRQQ